MQRFTALLHSGLSARGHAVTVLAPTLQLARCGPAYRYGGLPKYLGYFDKFALFPRQLRRAVKTLRPDLVHITDHANAMYASAVSGVPLLVTCHDLLQIRVARGEVPRQSLGPAGRCYQDWIRTCLARLPHLACVSERTRADVLRLTGLPAARVAVIPNALNYPYQPVAADAARTRLDALLARHRLAPAALAAGPGGFLLHVGGAQWYKNREGLLVIVAELRRLISPPPQLVLVGPALSAAESHLATELGLDGQLVFFSGVSNPELEALYNLAEGLVLPSWEEGFGWPIAEAQACGCPVFTSNRAPMTEVGGQSSRYFDPTNPVGAARLIAAAWPGRAARRDVALAESRRWQPALMLDAYEARYREITA
jgi:glycosyltransferase involved in cell wall biosynthesis